VTRPVRHYIVPDTQIRPGDPIDHLDWISADIIRRKPDVIVCLGDWWDFPSMSSHSEPGSLEKEGARFTEDLKAGNDAVDRFMAPIQEEIARIRKNKKRYWTPRFVFLKGNHEDRADRFAKLDARLEGAIGSHLCKLDGWEVFPFLEPVESDGVWYSHFWKSQNSPRPIGGTIDSRLNKLGFSFVQGHEQVKLYAPRSLPNGKTIHGLVVGACYLGVEGYRGPQSKHEWRGSVVLHDVRDGDYEPMFLTLRYLCRQYTGQELVRYMSTKYPDKDWTHLK
jgi:hypothetical protein